MHSYELFPLFLPYSLISWTPSVFKLFLPQSYRFARNSLETLSAKTLSLTLYLNQFRLLEEGVRRGILWDFHSQSSKGVNPRLLPLSVLQRAFLFNLSFEIGTNLPSNNS